VTCPRVRRRAAAIVSQPRSLAKVDGHLVPPVRVTRFRDRARTEPIPTPARMTPSALRAVPISGGVYCRSSLSWRPGRGPQGHPRTTLPTPRLRVGRSPWRRGAKAASLRSVKRVSRFALRLEAADSGSTRKCDRLGSNAHLLASSRFVPGRLGSSRGRVAHGSKRPGVRLAARPRALGWASTHAWWKAASLKKNNGSRSFATNDGKEVAASPSVMISPQIGHFVKPRTRTASSHPPKTSSGDLPKAATNSSGRTHRASRSRRTTGRLRPSHTDACAQ
jgi:hypothetical protein